MAIDWQWCSLAELSLERVYAVFAARQAVFVVEQTSIYQDLDGLDLAALHLIGWSRSEVAAYLRVLQPGERFAERSIGRVLTTSDYRRIGLGQTLMAKAVEYIDARHPREPIRIGAQVYLERFYGSFGFETVSEQYMEDGIPHVEMLRTR